VGVAGKEDLGPATNTSTLALVMLDTTKKRYFECHVGLTKKEADSGMRWDSAAARRLHWTW
jgi:hypothetical protein